MPADRVAGRARVIHTLGYPLRLDEFGGGFIYGMPDGRRVGRLRDRAGLPATRCSIRTSRSSTSSAIRCVAGAARGRRSWFATAPRRCPKAAGTPFPRVYADGVLIAGDAGGFLEFDAAQGHPSGDAHRHARGGERLRRGPRRRYLRGAAAQLCGRRSTRARCAASCIPCATSIRASAMACSPGWLTRACRCVAGGWWYRDPMPAHAGYDRMATLEECYKDGRPDIDAPHPPGEDRSAADLRPPDQRALLRHASRRGSAVAPDRPRHRHLPARAAATSTATRARASVRPTSTRWSTPATARAACRSMPRTASTARPATSWIPIRSSTGCPRRGRRPAVRWDVMLLLPASRKRGHSSLG